MTNSWSDVPSLQPEDGSLSAARWYSSRRSPYFFNKPDNWKRMEAALEQAGVQIKDLGSFYSWPQDVTLWGADGRFWQQPEYPLLEASELRFSMGVYYDRHEGQAPLRILSNVMHGKFPELPQPRLLSKVAVEGAEIFSGRGANGGPFVIVSEDLPHRLMAAFSLTYPEALVAISQDLQVTLDNVTVVPEPAHLDLWMMVLPNQVVLVHDPGQAPLITKAAVTDRFAGDSVGLILDEASQRLKDRGFTVVRVAGSFGDAANFFNGIVLRSVRRENRLVIATNRATSFLQKYWRRTLEAIVSRYLPGTTVEVHFIGEFMRGAGLNCAGSLAGPFSIRAL